MRGASSISVTRGWVEFQPIEGEDAADRLRVAVAEVRSIQFEDGAEAGASSGRTTTFEIGGGGDRVEPQEPDGGLGSDDVIRPRRDRSQRGRAGTVGGRDGTVGATRRHAAGTATARSAARDSTRPATTSGAAA